jgi:ParB family chromosome partitioning protein
MEIKHQIVSLPIDSIEIVPGDNPRQNFNNLFDLKESMEKIGQIDEVIVHRVGDKNVLLGGERRIRAAKEAGKPFIMAKVFENLDALTELRLSSGHNTHEPLTGLEKAREYQRYIDRLGWTTKQVAAEFKVVKETVERALKLLTLPDDIQKMMNRDVNPLPVHQALMLVKLPEEKQRQAAREIAPVAGTVMGESEAKKLLDEKYGDPKLNMQEPEEASEVSPAAEQAEPEKVERTRSLGDIKPVGAKIGIAGKLFAATAGIEILKATLTVAIDKDVKVISLDRIFLGNNSDLMKMIKKHQPEKKTKKDTKTKAKTNKSEKTETETETESEE